MRSEVIGCFPGSITGWMIEYDNWRVTGRMFSTTGGKGKGRGKRREGGQRQILE